MNTNRHMSSEWVHPFTARPAEVSELRRLTSLYLDLWGLSGVGDVAQLCVSELATNVISHVGEGAPAVLSVMVSDEHLRIALRDAESQLMPRLLGTTPTSETGRGLALVAAVAERWGVTAAMHGKTTWCEIAASCTGQVGGATGPLLPKVDFQPAPSGQTLHGWVAGGKPLNLVAQEEAAVGHIAEVLRWLRAQGHDPDTILDYAHLRLEGECGTLGG